MRPGGRRPQTTKSRGRVASSRSLSRRKVLGKLRRVPPFRRSQPEAWDGRHNGPCDPIAANILTMHRLLTGWGAARDGRSHRGILLRGCATPVMASVVPRIEGNVVSRSSNESDRTATQRVGVGSGFIVRNPQSISSIRNAIWQMSPGQLHLRSGT